MLECFKVVFISCHSLLHLPAAPARFAEVGRIDGQVDMFCITEKGSRALVMTQSVHDMVQLVKFRLHKSTSTNYTDFVFFEAILELSRQGWSHEVPQGVKRLGPYKQGKQKIWYLASQTAVQYLHVLLYADQMFQKGCLAEVYHCQPAGYYKTILDLFKRSPELMKEVKPNQPLAYYKMWKQKKHGRTNHGHSAPATDARTSSAFAAIGDLEVEEGWTEPGGNSVKSSACTHTHAHTYTYRELGTRTCFSTQGLVLQNSTNRSFQPTTHDVQCIYLPLQCFQPSRLKFPGV
jgi:hypothetical protein